MAEMPPITDVIERASQTIPGWSPPDQMFALFTLAMSTAGRGGDLLELGSWCGRSAVALGLAAKLCQTGRLHCVDLWPEKADWVRNPDDSYSFAVSIGGKRYGAYEEQTVWAEPYQRDILPVYERFGGTFEAFNSAIAEHRLNEWVGTHRGDLQSFADSAPKELTLRLAFIDGDHSYAAVVRDIRIAERFLMPGGWLCFDDAFTSYDGVDQAIRELVIESGRYTCCQQLTRKMFVARLR